ncbi:CAP domain-containing protein [Oscillatoria acuminata]|uniref:Uncharacterized protein with SCP/PR1 domains n=1 Tax=Oscillatoria acuminata PCC 6304 TaxID=56110 RepID=K9TL15_9CYAN|nr:CAP domain-containing protein [Oscillatoria acuminata]AFY83230.1 uncharacterized protein with SCP/PR1 domains [Oscillatoria acuminata PCC 6304]
MAINIYAPSELDNLQPEEVKLYNLVNQYRAENGLPPIRASKALTLVANRRVLDLAENIGQVTHDWSDASFSGNPEVMWNAPQRLNTGYPGRGYENVAGFSGFDGPNMTAEKALDIWKNSTAGHRQVILNQPGPNADWSQRPWNALGVGIYKGYAVLWFGEEVDPTGEPTRELAAVEPPPLQNEPQLPDISSIEILLPPLPNPPPPMGPVQTSDPVTGPGPQQAIYRFFDTLSGTHFYTASELERDNVRNTLPQYRYEGPSFAAPIPNPATSSIHRFFNTQTGTHFFTISEVERNQVLRDLPQYNYEGVAYHAYMQSESGTTPLHRFFNTQTGTHFYTPSDVERDVVMNTLPEYNYEGIGYYVNNLALV